MTFLLAIITVIILEDTLNHHIVAIHQFFQLFVFFTVENLLDFLDTLIQLIIVVGHYDDMQRFIIFKNVLGLFVSSSASYSNLAATSVLDQFLSPSTLTNDLADVVSFGVFDCVVSEIDLFELLQRFVIVWGNEARIGKVVRLSHFHAIFNERDPFSEEIVPFTDLSGVDSFSGVIVDRFGTGRAQVGVVHAEMAHLRGLLDLVVPSVNIIVGTWICDVYHRSRAIA
jgi:hypothetical protein